MQATTTRATSDISEALRHFDQLPDSAHIRAPDVAMLRGYSVGTVWRKSRNGELPKPEKISAAITAWNVGKLRAAWANHPDTELTPRRIKRQSQQAAAKAAA